MMAHMAAVDFVAIGVHIQMLQNNYHKKHPETRKRMNAAFVAAGRSKHNKLARAHKVPTRAEQKRQYQESKGGKGKWSSAARKRQSNRMKQLFADETYKANNKWFAAGHNIRHSENTRKKIGDKVRKSFEDGRNKPWAARNTITFAESYWKGVLDIEHIAYEFQYRINKRDYDSSAHGVYFLDFRLPGNVDLEIDGKQHRYPEHIERDTKRDIFMSSIGYTVYRIQYWDAHKFKHLCKQQIADFIAWYKDFCNTHNINPYMSTSCESKKS